MKKQNYLLWISLIVVALIIGGIIGSKMFSSQSFSSQPPSNDYCSSQLLSCETNLVRLNKLDVTSPAWHGEIPLWGKKSVNWQDCVSSHIQASNQLGTFPSNAICYIGSVSTENNLGSLPPGNIGWASCSCWERR